MAVLVYLDILLQRDLRYIDDTLLLFAHLLVFFLFYLFGVRGDSKPSLLKFHIMSIIESYSKANLINDVIHSSLPHGTHGPFFHFLLAWLNVYFGKYVLERFLMEIPDSKNGLKPTSIIIAAFFCACSYSYEFHLTEKSKLFSIASIIYAGTYYHNYRNTLGSEKFIAANLKGSKPTRSKSAKHAKT